MKIEEYLIILVSSIMSIYGIYCYITDGIITGNYGLIAIPIGFGVLIGFLIKFISESDVILGQDNKQKDDSSEIDEFGYGLCSRRIKNDKTT
jgi:hypothetical protein